MISQNGTSIADSKYLRIKTLLAELILNIMLLDIDMTGLDLEIV